MTLSVSPLLSLKHYSLYFPLFYVPVGIKEYPRLLQVAFFFWIYVCMWPHTIPTHAQYYLRLYISTTMMQQTSYISGPVRTK